MQLTPNQIESFARWIELCGGEVLTPCSEHEILRVIVRGRTESAHQRRSGIQTWPIKLADLYKIHAQGGHNPRLSVGTKVPPLNGNRRSRIVTLAERDGWRCWYCTVRLQPLGYADIAGALTASVEEVCPRAVGGPTHINNQVLACIPCNNLAANLPVVDKVRLREMMRASPVLSPIPGKNTQSVDGESTGEPTASTNAQTGAGSTAVQIGSNSGDGIAADL